MKIHLVTLLLLLSLIGFSQPKLVGSGTISTPLDEFGAAFMPDGKTCFFTVKSPSTISTNVMVI